jgi:hypothetical protein
VSSFDLGRVHLKHSFFVNFKHILLIAKSLFIATFAIMKMESKQREAFSKVVMALLDAKNLSQRQVALELDTSPSNFNQRILAGSMRPGMIMQFNKLLGVDLLRLVYLHEQGDSLSSIMEIAAQSEDYEHAGREMQPSSELFEMIAAQNRTISELQHQIQDLVNQLNKWIEHDMQKSQQQQEVIALMQAQKTAGKN